MRIPASRSVLIVAALVAGAVVVRAQTADEIIEKHIAAVGGRAALAKITSRHTTGTVTISAQGTAVSGPVSQWSKAPNKSRVFVTLDTVPLGGAGEMVIDQRFDGTSGVVLNSLQGDTAIGGNQLDNMRNDAFPMPFLVYKERGTQVALLPREKIGTREMIVLQTTPKAGSVSRLYVDPSTWMITRAVARVSTPELGEFEHSLDFSDYRDVDGVKIAFLTVNTMPMQTVTIKLDKVAHNVAIDDAMFAKKKDDSPGRQGDGGFSSAAIIALKLSASSRN